MVEVGTSLNYSLALPRLTEEHVSSNRPIPRAFT
jgi:hypothetical protein